MNSTNIPLITIITVSYNAVKTIEDTIVSVLGQTYNNIEYIIIDGGSTDGTLDIIKKYQDKITYWVSEPDKGIYDAMNKGIAKANGELIGIINADDWYELNAIEQSVEIYKQERFDVLYGNMNFLRRKGYILKITPPENIKKIKKKMIICHPSCFITKNAYNKWGLYDKSFKIAADYDLLLRYYIKGAIFKKVNFLIANFREGGVSSYFSIKNFLENIKARKNNKVFIINIEDILALCYFTLKKIFKK